jgi:ankyrin repeat protein
MLQMESALYCAAQAGYLNIMKLLINKGANVNGVSSYNTYGYQMEYFAPLHVASQKGHTSAVQLLIDHNVDVNKYRDWEIRQDICERGYVQIFKIFLSQRMNLIHDPVLLFDVIKRGRIQMVKILLEKGANVNATQFGKSDGYISLDFARNNEDMQKLLIAYGAKERENCIIQ